MRAARVLMAVGLMLAAMEGDAAAVTEDRLRQLPMIVEAPGAPLRNLGPLGRYLGALRRAKHRCKLGTYDYGGSIDCDTAEGRRVLIGIHAVPTRAPDYASVADVRPDGVDSQPLARADIPAFLDALARIPRRSNPRATKSAPPSRE